MPQDVVNVLFDLEKGHVGYATDLILDVTKGLPDLRA